MISHLSIPKQKKIFARATPHESAMSRAKIAPAAARSDAVRGCSFGPLAARVDPGAERAAAASTTAIAKRSTARAVVRGRSLDASSAASHPGPLAWDILGFPPCTPARWMAEKMDRQCSARDGSGGAVLARTEPEPLENRQTIEIAGEVRPVLGFSRLASRHVRVRLYAQGRAHYARENTRTTEPHNIFYVDQWVNGSDAVLSWFCPEPASRVDPQPTEIRDFRNKIGGGYSIWATSCPSILPIRGQIDGRGGETFGAGIPAGRLGGRVGGADLDQGAALERNGGNAWVSGARIGHVQTPMFKHRGENGGNAWVVERRRKLCRLTGAASTVGLVGASSAAAIAAPRGVAPPSAARPVLRPFAHAFFQISAQARFHACPAGSPEARQVGLGRTGPGVRASLAVRHAATGRGVIANLGLCRSGKPSAGGVHVN